MYIPEFHKFEKLIQEFPIVPIAKIIPLKLQPLEIYTKFSQKEFFFLLDSARFHPKTGRFSFIGFNPFMVFKSKGKKIEIIHGEDCEVFDYNPIERLREIFLSYKSSPHPFFPSFSGGAVGYFAYDVGRLFEDFPQLSIDDIGLPEIYLAFYDNIIAIDHLENKIFIISNAWAQADIEKAYRGAIEKIENLSQEMRDGYRIKEKGLDFVTDEEDDLRIISNFSKEGFEEMVRRANEYIRKGDIYQANLSQRFSIETNIEPFLLYRILRAINPSPFAAYINFPEVKIVSSSPERLLRVEGSFVQTRPIAGTRPKGRDAKENLRLRRELILNEKERAEHIMLVDLERNDLGRVCNYGTVKVDEFMVLEEYSHVIHIVSNVCGILSENKDRFDLMRSAFPGGTITGCPKIRCMEIIEELEPVRRGIYCGSIGYLGFNGNMDLNIVIRTFILTQGRAYVQVGAGIVADSEPTKEYYETLHKAEALLKAIKIAERNVANQKLQTTGK
ncbi:MAG: anthranilate synthase component I family protein [Candidatus Omnitrophica bacterium]|nr:anthranilate synthase component I family protein [Candidatus Omnitrophota bacterium]